MKIRNSLIVVALVLATGLAGVAQDKTGSAGDAPKLVIASFTHDFGEVKPGTPLSYSFIVKNQGKGELQIQSVTPGCGCTASSFDKTVPAGKEGKITLEIAHTENYAGEMAKSAQVVTNDPANQSFNLLLRAYFKPDVGVAPPTGQPVALASAGKLAGPFNISPSDRWVTSILTGGSSTGTLNLYNGSGTPVRVRQLKPGGTDFTANLQTIEEGKRYEVSVATNPALKPGQYHQTMKLETDSKAAPELEIELAVTVFPKVFAMPSMMSIPQISLTSDLSAVNLPLIYVRKLREGGLRVSGVSSTLPFLKLQLATESEGQVYTIRLTLDRSKVTSQGDFKGKIKIETNDEDAPILEVSVNGSFI